MNQERFALFSAAYRAGLKEAVTKYPAEYDYKPEQSDIVADKMLKAMQEKPKGVLYTNSKGFRLACQILGIKYTVKSIFQFLEVT